MQTIEIKKNKKPVLTAETRSIKERLDLLFILSRYKPELLLDYRNIKRQYDASLIEDRKRSNSSIIYKAENKSKAAWNVVREATNTYKKTENVFPTVNDKDDRELFLLANRFNDFFINISNPNHGFNACPTTDCNKQSTVLNSFCLFEVPESEIFSVVKMMNNKRSFGYDGVPMTLIKRHFIHIVKPVCFLINSAFRSGIFPDALKKSIVMPSYKKNDKNDLSNYRPISLITSFAKIFEKILSNRILKFFRKFNVLTTKQHGFTENKSTDTVIFEFLQCITLSLERGEIPAGLFVDFSKAFDCVDHKTLLLKLERSGIRGMPLKLFESYLINRKQVVVLRNGKRCNMSQEGTIVRGVPQGTILGPILFIVYINDLPNIFQPQEESQPLQLKLTAEEVVDTYLYADDTNIIVSSKVIERVMTNLTTSMSMIENWCDDCGLRLNLNKTSVVIFLSSRSNLKVPDNITFDNGTVQIGSQTKLLGVYIDKHLNWSVHCETLTTRLNSIIYMIRALRNQVDLNTLKMIYFAIFQSIVSYGIIFWGGSSSAERVFLTQKLAIRTIFHMKFRESCRGVFKENNILTLPGLYIYRILLFFHKNKLYFESCKNVNSTRRIYEYFFPPHKLSSTEHSTFYMCLRLFNYLPRILRNIFDFKIFKKTLFSMIMDCEPYSITEFKEYCILKYI